MEKHPTTSGLSPKKLAELWNIASKTDKTEKIVDEDDKKIELLRDWLTGTLSMLVSSEAKPRRRKGIDLRSVVISVTDLPIEKLLHDPETDIALLRVIKEQSKKLSGTAKSKAEYHAANTIYYAALASALVFHDCRITKFSYKELEKYFSRISKENWIPESLRTLFKKACDYSRLR
jgi:hypothetical protein